MQFHHIGYLVDDLDEAVEQWTKLGFEQTSEVFHIRSQNVKLCFLSNYGDSFIELVEPAPTNRSLRKLLEKKTHFYHLAYKSKEYQLEKNRLQAQGLHLVNEFQSEAFEGKNCSFYVLPTGGLIELIES